MNKIGFWESNYPDVEKIEIESEKFEPPKILGWHLVMMYAVHLNEEKPKVIVQEEEVLILLKILLI